MQSEDKLTTWVLQFVECMAGKLDHKIGFPESENKKLIHKPTLKLDHKIGFPESENKKLIHKPTLLSVCIPYP